VARDSRESRIDDGRDSLYGYGSFRDVRREDELSSVGGTDGLVLLRAWKFAVQGQHAQARFRRDSLARRLRATYRSRARQEDEYVSVQAFFDKTTHGRFDLSFERALVVTRGVLDLDFKTSALGAERLAAEIAGDGRGVERRGHRDDF
jgi:hypothetical protein